MPDSTPNPFLGCWLLESCRGICGDKTNHPFGLHPFGMLIYTEQSMMAFISSTSREPFSTHDLRAILPEEIMADFSQYESYCGGYAVDNEHSIITHHIQSSKIPNHIGTALSRYFSFKTGVLVLKSIDSLMLNNEPWFFEFTWNKQQKAAIPHALPTMIGG